jgi:hypothetical protein
LNELLFDSRKREKETDCQKETQAKGQVVTNDATAVAAVVTTVDDDDDDHHDHHHHHRRRRVVSREIHSRLSKSLCYFSCCN